MTLTHPGTTGTDPAPQFASAVDLDTYGEYRVIQRPDDPRPLYRFTGRLSSPRTASLDGRPAFLAEPGRYHLYSGLFCPWAHRSTLVIALAGLQDVVPVSYVDNERDARGWAFRASNGPDPVNGFTLLRQAYEATEPGFDGHVSVPALWDRRTGQLVANDYRTLDADLATEFQDWSTTGIELYPAALRPAIDDLDAWLHPVVNQGVGIAAGQTPEAEAARTALLEAFGQLDQTLSSYRYLLGSQLTLADLRLWVTLARYDAASNVRPGGGAAIGPALSEFPALWAYARAIYQLPAVRSTTDWSSFTRPGAVLPDWDEPGAADWSR